MDGPARHHPLLGELRWDERLKWWEAQVELTPGLPVALCLNAEKEYQVYAAPEELFEAGAEYLVQARAAEPRCRRVEAGKYCRGRREWPASSSRSSSPSVPPAAIPEIAVISQDGGRWGMVISVKTWGSSP